MIRTPGAERDLDAPPGIVKLAGGKRQFVDSRDNGISFASNRKLIQCVLDIRCTSLSKDFRVFLRRFRQTDNRDHIGNGKAIAHIG